MVAKSADPGSGRLVIALWVALVLFLLAPMAVMLSLGSPPEPVPSNVPAPRAPTMPGTGPQQAAPAATDLAPGGSTASMQPAGPGEVRATRTAIVAADLEPLADRPTACLRVVDRASGAPIAGAAVRRVQGSIEIAFTDEQGLAPVPLQQAEQLAVIATGYLLRMAPTQLGTNEAAPQQVQLVPDAWSASQRFEFSVGGRQLADNSEVFARFLPLTRPTDVRHGPGTEDVVAMRAWQEHTLLAALPVGADAGVQLGQLQQDHVHRLRHGGVVRFAAAGEYEIEAVTADGFAARTRFVAKVASGEIPTVKLSLAPAAFVAGVVLAAGSGQPLPGAELTLQGSDPLALVAKTGADGGFRLGPLAAAEVTLLVRHGDHQPTNFGPVRSTANSLRIVLQPLPQTALRGLVRSRPDGQPVVGAHVAWLPTGADPITATTDGDGRFALSATGNQATRLLISASGFANYLELVEPGAPFAEYHLLPATTEARLRHGLTARLVGQVVDAQGQALPGVSVRWIPARPAAPAGLPTRRILDGGSLNLPLVVPTGPDGLFELETTHFGPGRICLAEAGPDAIGGLQTEATAGATKDGLRLQR